MSALSPRDRFLLVHNPTAGVSGRRLTDDVVRHLQVFGAQVDRHGADADVFDWSQAALRYQAVIAAGGDGTIRALGAALANTELALAIIPQGTGNVLAHEIGWPRRAEAIADLIRSGPAVDVTGATANGEPFFLMAGIGFDAAVVRGLQVAVKRRIGKAAYTGPVMAALRSRPDRLLVEIDGQSRAAGWVVVANAQSYGGSFCLTRQAGLDREGLVAVVMAPAGRARLLRQLIDLGLGGLDRSKGVEVLPARVVRVRRQTEDEVPVQVDGDTMGTTPVEIVWGAPKLRLIVPEAYARRFEKQRDRAAEAV